MERGAIALLVFLFWFWFYFILFYYLISFWGEGEHFCIFLRHNIFNGFLGKLYMWCVQLVSLICLLDVGCCYVALLCAQ